MQYFGASSLQIKISRFWQEIPADDYAAFREKLIDAVMFYANGPKIVLTRLCLAVSETKNLKVFNRVLLMMVLFKKLSSMILHSIPDQWTSPLSDFISILQRASGGSQLKPQHVNLLLEILTVLPEEVSFLIYFLYIFIFKILIYLLNQFQSMRLAHERKIAIRGELLKAVKDGINVLKLKDKTTV